MIYVCAAVDDDPPKGEVWQAGDSGMTGEGRCKPGIDVPSEWDSLGRPREHRDQAVAWLGTTQPLAGGGCSLQRGEVAQDLPSPNHTVEGLARLASADRTAGHV